MENFIETVKFLGSLILLFAIVHLIGHLLKLDKFYKDQPEGKKETDNKMINKNLK